MGERPTAELEEALNAGRTGKPCPFCGSHATRRMVELHDGGLIDSEWACSNCDETGPVFDGVLYMPDPEGDEHHAA